VGSSSKSGADLPISKTTYLSLYFLPKLKSIIVFSIERRPTTHLVILHMDRLRLKLYRRSLTVQRTCVRMPKQGDQALGKALERRDAPCTTT
jgi:hypothetical protein